MSKIIDIDGVAMTVADDDPRLPLMTAFASQTIFDPETLITTLFTPAEQIGFTSKPQGVLFMGLIAAAQTVDVTSAVFKGYIAQAVAGGFLTQARADQVMSGTPAPQAT